MKKGNTVLYNKFGIGCTDIEMGGDSYIMIKEGDLIGTFPNTGATADDIPKMSPMVRSSGEDWSGSEWSEVEPPPQTIGRVPPC